MFRPLSSVLLALTISLTSLGASGWPIDKIEKSLGVLRFEGGGFCTAFLIDASSGHWVTANHCVGARPRLNDQVALLLHQSPEDPDLPGLAVYRASVPGKQALRLGQAPPRGVRLLVIGYGGGSPRPFFYEGLSIDHGEMTMNSVPIQLASMQSMSGMSGGPVLNEKIQVVGIDNGGIYPDHPQPGGALLFSPTYAQTASVFRRFGPLEAR